jgi:2-aminobenzoate-CoA ligase
MLSNIESKEQLSSLRVAVSAGETLPAPIFEEWSLKTGKPILDGIGATEMLHIFISNRLGEAKPACTGRPLTGYAAKIVDDAMNEVPRGTVGRLAVRGPIGCRYLADSRQMEYVSQGWNLTGDSFFQDEEGCFHFAARSDDIIVSGGYNIAGPEVEAALLKHDAVVECAVIGVPDEARGTIVQAHVVLTPTFEGSQAMERILQDYVKSVIAPYKYPRSIIFTSALPKTESGKIQRFRLRTAS